MFIRNSDEKRGGGSTACAEAREWPLVYPDGESALVRVFVSYMTGDLRWWWGFVAGNGDLELDAATGGPFLSAAEALEDAAAFVAWRPDPAVD